MQDALQTYIQDHLPLLKQRDFLLEIFTECTRQPLQKTLESRSAPYRGKLLLKDGTFVSLETFTRTSATTWEIQETRETGISLPKTGPLTFPRDRISLPGGLLQNAPSPLQTTIGRLILNYLILSEPFGDAFPYINDAEWGTGRLEKGIFTKAVSQEITADQINEYVRNLYFIGHFTEICVPNFTERSLVTDPKIAKRRKELLKEHADALSRNDPVAMSRIEEELIDMDKAWLQDDPSWNFLRKNTNKSFSVQRKKMLVTAGMIERFGEEGAYDYVEQSLSEGITPQTFSKVVNEIRHASYARAIQTQDGGVIAKSISRGLQNARMKEEDCKTKRTLPVTLSPDTMHLYRYRWILETGKLVLLDDDALQARSGKTVQLRTPMMCQTQGGFCRICLGKIISELSGTELTARAMGISGKFTGLSLKKSHGRSVKSFTIESLSLYAY